MTDPIAKISLDGMTAATIPDKNSSSAPRMTAEDLAKNAVEWFAGFSNLENLSKKVQVSLDNQGISLSPEESGKISKGILMKALSSAVSSGRRAVVHDEKSAMDLIAGFESFRGRIYLDQGGKPTIGFGHLLRPGEQQKFANGITREQGLSLLKADMADAVHVIEELVKVSLNENQHKALTSFVFNIGSGKFSFSKLLRELNAGKYEQVSTEMNRWVYVDGKISRGLQNRREMEGILFDTPVSR